MRVLACLFVLLSFYRVLWRGADNKSRHIDDRHNHFPQCRQFWGCHKVIFHKASNEFIEDLFAGVALPSPLKV